MSKESIIRDDDGNPTHIRVTTDDGSRSILHEYDDSNLAGLIGDRKGERVEIADHNEDGTTDAYEYDNSLTSGLSGDHRGEQKNDSGGLCFLTTACVEHAGLPDDCHELTVLRHFRDDYVANVQGGASLISEYYATAPGIVSAVAQRQDHSVIWRSVLAEIRSIVHEIEVGSRASALARYKALFESLKLNVSAED